MTDLAYAVLSVLVLVLAGLVHPSHATCPSRHYLNGVRPNGAFSCLRVPLGDPNYDGTWGHPDHSIQPPGELEGRIYCTGGAHPIVVDERTVGCQRS